MYTQFKFNGNKTERKENAPRPNDYSYKKPYNGNYRTVSLENKNNSNQSKYRSTSQNNSLISNNKEVNTYNTNHKKNLFSIPLIKNIDQHKILDKSPQRNNLNPNIPKPVKAAPLRLEMIYKKGLEKHEKIRKLREEQTIKKQQDEIAGCTFKPKLNKTVILDNIYNQKEISLHERNKMWNDKKLEK